MTMFNKVTNQQGEWVTIEDMEFLEVDGKYIKKDDVGADWVEFNDQTTEMLLELVESVGRDDDDVSFVLLEHVNNGAQVIGHKVSDRMVLEFIVALIESFIEDDPMKMVMLMVILKELWEDKE